MLKMKKTLKELQDNDKTINVAVIGIGKMGRSLVDRLLQMDGMNPSLIVNRHIEKARKALEYLGIDSKDIIEVNSANELEIAIKNNKYAISDDFKIATDSDLIDAVVEATGNPAHGARVAYYSIKSKKHIIMLNVECDSVVGPTLYKMAKDNGVIYTGAAGDEPAAMMELFDFAEGLGFEVIAAGKGKNNPKDIHATNDSVADLAKEKSICEKSLTSFVDATNTMIELNAVANATGFTPDVFGCHGIKADVKTLPSIMSLKEEGGILDNYKTLDYVHGIAPGVFVIIKGNTKEEIDTLKYVGMGDGPNYIIYRPYHLCSLELPVSIYKAVVENESTIAPEAGQICDTVAHAKCDMKAGDYIFGIGSDFTYGSLTTHKDAKEKNLLPIALITENTRLKVDVNKDELITYDMVELDETEIITKLRREQDKNE